MIKEYSDISEIIFVLENLREEDKQEMQALYGENWKKKTLDTLKDKSILVVYGNCGSYGVKPIAIGGFYEQFEDKTFACVWLLSSFFIYENKILFLKEFKKQLLIADKKYRFMYNFMHKSNFAAKKWLKKFGFKFDNSNPNQIKTSEGFEFFYKVN